MSEENCACLVKNSKRWVFSKSELCMMIMLLCMQSIIRITILFICSQQYPIADIQWRSKEYYLHIEKLNMLLKVCIMPWLLLWNNNDVCVFIRKNSIWWWWWAGHCRTAQEWWWWLRLYEHSYLWSCVARLDQQTTPSKIDYLFPRQT